MSRFPKNLNLHLDSDCVNILDVEMHEQFGDVKKKATATLQSLIRTHGKFRLMTDKLRKETGLAHNDIITMALCEYLDKCDRKG